ncbi:MULTISPECIES: hypothetical protein [Pseudocitrobacter]
MKHSKGYVFEAENDRQSRGK